MNTELRPIALGTAALALAAACLSPVAHADIRVPLAPGDSSSSDSSSNDDNGVGSSAGKARNNRGAVARGNTGSDTSAGSTNTAPDGGTSGSNDTAPDALAADAPKSNDAPPNRASTDISSAATGSNPLLQNPLWWFGTPNPNPPPGVQIIQTTPLADLPGWARPAFGWFTENIAENCVLGISNTVVGPYGTSTSRLSAGC